MKRFVRDNNIKYIGYRNKIGPHVIISWTEEVGALQYLSGGHLCHLPPEEKIKEKIL